MCDAQVVAVNPSEMQPAQQYRADGLALVKSCGVDVPVRGPSRRVLVHRWRVYHTETEWETEQLKKCHAMIKNHNGMRSVLGSLFSAKCLALGSVVGSGDQHTTSVTTNRHSVPCPSNREVRRSNSGNHNQNTYSD